MPKVLRLEWALPDEAFGDGFDETLFITKVKEEVVMRLLKEQRISQGKASELLGVNRYDLFDLMARYDIPATDLSPEEMTQEFARADAFFRGKGA
jgi:predicted HTH domain antitoxin